ALARGGWFGYLLFAVAVVGAFLTGLYTFRMLFVAFGGEQSPFVREHPPHAAHDRLVDWSMGISVGVLTVLAAFGGWLQFADRWTPLTDWLDPVAKSLVEPSGTQETVASVCAVLVGVLGIGVAWWIYSARRANAPRSWAILEHKFYFDEA